MDSAAKHDPTQTALFQVYLRLRPPINHSTSQTTKPDSYLTVEHPEPATEEEVSGESHVWPKHITVEPPNDSRKRAVERFAFTKVFEEHATQLDLFEETEMGSLIKGVLAEGRDGLVATLGVTGSGKTHTMLGSKSQRGMTQMSLDVLFRSLSSSICSPDSTTNSALLSSIAASDPSEAQLFSARSFLESIYHDPYGERGRASRAQTPMVASRSQTPMVCHPFQSNSPVTSRQKCPSMELYPELLAGNITARKKASSSTIRLIMPEDMEDEHHYGPRTKHTESLLPSQLPFWNSHKITKRACKLTSRNFKEPTSQFNLPRRYLPQRPSALPQIPDVSGFAIPMSSDDDYVVVVSMYEVYNDRIFDLLSPANGGPTGKQPVNQQKDRRRPLLFKSTETSPDRKVVAGLKKIVCSTYEEALMVLDTGLTERRVAGTGSNSVSSRSHGFFCVEVKKRVVERNYGEELWIGNTLTIVDLAGSERARNAKTAGATLAEAGKINESLMYLGQCLQMQSVQDGNKQALVPFRQCKLTELLFSNSFPSSNQISSHSRIPQKAIMIVTADPLGDFNATSQILRYSALAREVTVPRIPSVTSTILSGTSNGSKNFAQNGRSTLYSASAEELETAALEIARISDEYDALALKLAEEEIARAEAEIKWKNAEERCAVIEQEVREECWEEMEARMEEEKRRWQIAWEEQANRHDEHLDKKLELLSRGVKIHEDPEPSANDETAELEQENEMLRRRIATLERELLSKSPTKKTKTKKNTMPGSFDPFSDSFVSCDSDAENVFSNKLDHIKLDQSLLSSPLASTPKKRVSKQRALTSRQRDLGPVDDDY